MAECAVRVEKVTKAFGSFRAIEKVSFELNSGEVLGFLGPNGAGKTTTVRILAGYFPPTEGRVMIGGKNFYDNPTEAKKRIGYLPESVSLYGDMRVMEFLEFAAEVKGVRKKEREAHVEEILSRCGLFEARKKLIQHLSKGYRQRVGLAQAIVGNPDLVILDEPTNGLDPKQIIEIRGLIRELSREKTVVISSHILPEVSMLCDRVMIMNKGRIVASGTTEELEAGLKNVHEIFVVIGNPAKKEQALTLLRSIAGIERVSMGEEKDGEVLFTLVAPKGEDLRPVISRLFVEQEIPLHEIRSARLSLEEIFMQIVTNEPEAGVTA